MSNISQSKQARNGKAFEYALLLEFAEKLERRHDVELSKSEEFCNIKKLYDSLEIEQKMLYRMIASSSINLVCDLTKLSKMEPSRLRLQCTTGPSKGLTNIRITYVTQIEKTERKIERNTGMSYPYKPMSCLITGKIQNRNYACSFGWGDSEPTNLTELRHFGFEEEFSKIIEFYNLALKMVHKQTIHYAFS